MQTIAVVFLILLSRLIPAQDLEPVSACSAEPLPANRSGTIIYVPAITSGNCSLILTGLQKGDQIMLEGLRVFRNTQNACSSEFKLKINDAETDNDSCTVTAPQSQTFITIAESQLKLEVIAPGVFDRQIYYYHSK